jgi:hypothetical protein
LVQSCKDSFWSNVWPANEYYVIYEVLASESYYRFFRTHRNP